MTRAPGGGRRSGGAPAPAALLSRLQQGVGNASVQRLVQGARPPGTARLQRAPAKTHGRRAKAQALGAPDARWVVLRQLPFVLPHLSAEQLERLQRGIDATAINPGVKERYAAAETKAEKQYGSLTIRDEKLGHAADKIADELVPVEASDKRIRLDLGPLLPPDLFVPTSHDPDEVTYLASLRASLDERGIWLLVGDGADPEVWLSIGPEADYRHSLKAPLGVVTRVVLEDTVIFGARYYEMVLEGPTRRRFDADSKHLWGEMMGGLQEHLEQRRIRDTAAPGVVGISDWLGDADYPDEKIWDVIFEENLKAQEAMNAGEVDEARGLLAAAGILTQRASRLLSQYVDASNEGAAIAVKWLRRIKTVAEITEVALTGYGAVTAVAGAGAAGVEAVAEKAVADAVSKTPALAEDAIQVIKTARGTVDRGIAGGRGVGKGFERWP